MSNEVLEQFLVCDEGKSNKFYAWISARDKNFVAYGRIQSPGDDKPKNITILCIEEVGDILDRISKKSLKGYKTVYQSSEYSRTYYGTYGSTDISVVDRFYPNFMEIIKPKLVMAVLAA